MVQLWGASGLGQRRSAPLGRMPTSPGPPQSRSLALWGEPEGIERAKSSPQAGTQRSGISSGEGKHRVRLYAARMTPEVKHQLQARAHDANMTLTNYLIICGLGQEIVRIDGLDNLLSELKAQGRNLNQLTTLANMGQLTVLRGNDLISEYARPCDTVSTLVREVH